MARLPQSAHTSRPWRIHELTPRLRARGRVGAADAGRPGRLPAAGQAGRLPTRPQLFGRRPHAVRAALEGREAARLGRRRRRRRLARADAARPASGGPARDAARPEFDALPFSPLYLLDDEFAAEIANRTVHAVMHIGWVPDGADRYHGQMAVLVKPQRPPRDRLHGCDQAVPARARLPADAERDRAALAGARRRGDGGAR